MSSSCTIVSQNPRQSCCLSVIGASCKKYGANGTSCVNTNMSTCMSGYYSQCKNLATKATIFTTNYWYSSSWVSNTIAYYSSSTITSTSYDYYRTYTANSLVYSQSYNITYTTSQVNPKTSTY